MGVAFWLSWEMFYLFQCMGVVALAGFIVIFILSRYF